MKPLSSSTNQVEAKQFVRLIQDQLNSGKQPAFRPANSLAFPANPLSHEEHSSGRPVFELSFLGLYGVSSPLPHYFITDALDEENSALRGFLGIFNQIFYLAYFHAWQQKNPHLFHDSALRGHALISAMAGIPVDEQESLSPVAPLFLTRRRSLHGLSALVRALIPDIPFSIEITACDWIEVLEVSRLGKCRLGDNATLGPRIATQAQRVALALGPVTEFQAKDIAPSGSRGRLLLSCVHRFLNHAKMLDLEICVVYDQPRSQLGRAMSLGWNSFLKKQDPCKGGEPCSETRQIEAYLRWRFPVSKEFPSS
jgi:type VI secretion system protein ImpH